MRTSNPAARLARGGPPRPPGRRPQGLASTLFGRTRQAVFGLLFGHPAEAFYAREIARAVGVSVGTVQRELTELVGAGILERTVRGRQVYYQADRRCPIFEELRSIVAKTSGLADVLQAALGSLRDRLQAAFVFGSLSSSEGSPDSDVDVFVIGDVTLGEAIDALAGTESELGREVNPVVQSPPEFAKRAAAGNHFVTRVLAGPKLFLIGDDDVLGRLGAARLAGSAHLEPPGDRRSARTGAARSRRQPRPRRQR
jgi:uncharacterized protein